MSYMIKKIFFFTMRNTCIIDPLGAKTMSST